MGGREGRVGIRLADNRLALKTLAGHALPAELLLPVLEAVLPPETWEEAERQHRSRPLPWTVEVREGMSGCRTYRLRVLADQEWGFAPVVASLHVSMYGRLNMGIKPILLENALPLLAVVARDFPPPPTGRYAIRPVPPYRETEEFQEPGTPSGLAEVREALRVVQALEQQ